MSEHSKSTKDNEEIDLGQLFKAIGNAFQKLFDFVASIFKTLFHVLMLILAHFYKRFKWYVIAGILGLALGYYLDKSTDKRYGANMFIETHFSSSYQVYENIKNLNELAAADKDSVELAKVLGISVSEASKFKGFYIKHHADESDNAKKFSEYKKELDSVSRSEANYKDFVAGLDAHSFKTHQIGVVTLDKTIFSKLNKNFAKVLSENEYLNSLLKAELRNYENKEETLIAEERRMDSLINQYLKIRITQSNKQSTPGSGTNLFLGDAQKNELLVDEAALIEDKIKLAEKRRETAFEKVKNNDIVSVVSYFPSTGYSLQEWYEKAIIIYPALFLLALMLIFVILDLGKYVKKYQEQRQI